MAFSKVKAGGLADNSVGSSQISPDTVVASDIAANAVTASELADNAVDTDAIAANAVVTAKIADSTGASDGITTAKLATNAVTTAKITDANITTAKIADTNITAAKLNTDVTDGSAITTEVQSHIIPGVLQPAIGGKLLNGANHSGAYGTAQTQSGGDGHSYYYTDIKGSKPIKDPRIGAHFGSQRHKTKSVQLLEQETATHGQQVYSVDGREWMRFRGDSITRSARIQYDAQGAYINSGDAGTTTNVFFEITGYFNKANIVAYSNTYSGRYWDSCFVNGTEVTTNTSMINGTGETPLRGRFVDAASIVPIEMGTVNQPQITTISLKQLHNGENNVYAIELIAQDLSGSGSPNRSKIKFPAQNVVSFGKKFEIAETNHHYDPFNGFTNGTTTFGTKVDTATSLGLGEGTTYGAPWAISSSNHIRPFNGGRVVKWVDSDGTIKTSVTMMPANAQNIGDNASNGSAGTPSNPIATASATNTHTINFSNNVIDNSLSEVAGTFKTYEFGNGNANGDTSEYRDFSLDGNQQTADTNRGFVMDDGLTSLAGRVRGSYTGIYPDDTTDCWYLTFIGTGLSVSGETGTVVLAQNLPYGSHILKYTRASTPSQSPWVLDGIEIRQGWGSGGSAIEGHAGEFTFHQPKRPPIPEDCVVLADYMLMADFVVVGTQGEELISKGVRYCAASRDQFYDASGAALNVVANDRNQPNALRIASTGQLTSGQSVTHKLPYFGTDFVINTYGDRFGTITEDLNGGGTSATIGTTDYDACVKHTGNNLGANRVSNIKQNSGYFWLSSVEIASPIHTSSHYQSFETPFLRELVGGDRNMEQTNLICSSDGKTWDEITRNTSYIGNLLLNISRDGGDIASTAFYLFDIIRGVPSGVPTSFFNKDFSVVYDRVICLVDGHYKVQANIGSSSSNSSGIMSLQLNGSTIQKGEGDPESSRRAHAIVDINLFLKRGDYLQYRVTDGTFEGNEVDYNYFSITRI